MIARSGLLLAVAIVISALAIARVAHAEAKPTVAILYFDYTGKDDVLAMLRKGLAQMLISDLSALDAVQLVERDRLEDLLAELKLGQARKLDAATAAKAGKLLGARYMVLGGYFDLKQALRVDARVVEVETGKVIRSVGATGQADDFLGLEQRLAGEIRTILATQLALPPAKAAPAPRVKPPAKLSQKLAVLYARALHDLDLGNKPDAKAKLQQVVKQQADFQLAAIDLDKLMQ